LGNTDQTANGPSRGKLWQSKKPAFRIVAVGEDFAAVMRAQERSKQLAADLEPEFGLSSDAWKFDALDNSQLGRAAAREAAGADMIIIAANGDFEPPAQVKSWFECWVPQKRKGVTALTALIALRDHEDNTPYESSPLCAYLGRIARKWGMGFFSTSSDWWQHLEATAESPRAIDRKRSVRNEQILSSRLRLEGMRPQ
jgi:hypothetical protein